RLLAARPGGRSAGARPPGRGGLADRRAPVAAVVVVGRGGGGDGRRGTLPPGPPGDGSRSGGRGARPPAPGRRARARSGPLARRSLLPAGLRREEPRQPLGGGR